MNDILKACNVTKGALYHHFPNGKEELLIACLHAMNETITTDIVAICDRNPSTLSATQEMIEKLIEEFDREGTIRGDTFSSIVSEMASLSEPAQAVATGTASELTVSLMLAVVNVVLSFFVKKTNEVLAMDRPV